MRRRALLGGLAAVTAAVAGCSGVQSRLPGGGDQQSDKQVQQLQSTVDQKNQRIASLESRVKELETNNERFKQAVTRAKKRRITARYADALELRNQASSGWNTAIKQYQSKRFEAARFTFAQTSGFWGSAAMEFRSAATTAENQEVPNTQRLCTAARNHCTVMQNAATRFAQAADQYAAGRIQDGNDAVKQAKAAQQQANKHDVASLKKVRSSLNLG